MFVRASTALVLLIVLAMTAASGVPDRVSAQDPGSSSSAPDPASAPSPQGGPDLSPGPGPSAVTPDSAATPSATPPVIAGPKGSRLQSQLRQFADGALQASAMAAVPSETSETGEPSVAVTIRFDGPVEPFAAFLAEIPGIAIASSQPGAIEAFATAAALEVLEDVEAILSVEPIIPPSVDVTSQGAAVHNSPNWNSYGFSGDGIKVGIIDAGFQDYPGLVGTELPTPAAVRCYTNVGVFSTLLSACNAYTKHGTAVAEAVVDVAPGVTLYLANPGSYNDFIATTQWMAAQGVKVINMSLSWLWQGPGDGTSPYTNSTFVAVQAATSADIVWVNSAGNAALRGWTGVPADLNNNDLMEFGSCGDSNSVSLTAGQSYVFQLRWNDTWGNADMDLDLLLLNATSTLVAHGADAQSGGATHVPYEVMVYTPLVTGTYRIQVIKSTPDDEGDWPSWVQMQSRDASPNCGIASYSIGNPAESADSRLLAVGAARYSTPNSIESFSSRGPTRDNRVKPDITGTDGGNSAVWGAWFGTSQASPHVAGLAAILREAYPAMNGSQIAAQLKSWASPRGSPVPNNTWGAGLAGLPTIQGQAVLLDVDTAGAVAGEPFAGQPLAALVNASGQVLNVGQDVEIGLVATNGAALTCTGGLVATLDDGQYQYSGCEVDLEGGPYSLRITPLECFCVSTTYPPFDVSGGGGPDPDPGLLRVVTDPAVPASIYIDGVIRNSWGLNWMKFPPGTYTLSFGDVPGFATPEPQEITVTSNQTTSVTGNFTWLGNLHVITSPPVPSTISVNGVPRDNWGPWLDLPAGTYDVCFGPVANFTPPPCQEDVVVNGNGATTEITGVFAPSPGAPGAVGTGLLRVTTTPAAPSTIYVDGIARDAWGLDWMDIAPGTYTVSFSDIPGYATPEPQEVVVMAGQTTTVNGVFTLLAPLHIITSPAVPSTLFVDGIERDDWGVFTTFPAGTYEVCFGPVSGFITPNCQEVTLTAGVVTDVTGTFVPD